MQRAPIKIGLLAVVILEIGSLFFLLHIYNDFVSSPDSYYKNILVRQNKALKQIINESDGATN
ncbi:MAG: hypothetical protein A3B04_01195 [Candidatus Portnoybacteria bacterium RIFCSPLOWO2_02_FULL_39_11]|uniref:Uncharacterized protein n=1 Tax=Candidatus Portnoybacteria bacterium RIFCSPLOWO2_02_FULL_39_11 TaxID=1802001 RepID=A0A1G2FU34_9BACT|nr:MAG: hypothetical protein A3B04_01195 [Candidatus Portnoybacteria bacterium RIFCSPLOWO2_02_FULL_39_11]